MPETLNDILVECAKLRGSYPLMHRTLREFSWFCSTCIFGWTQFDQVEMDTFITDFPRHAHLWANAQKEKDDIQAKWGPEYQLGDSELILFARAFLEYCHQEYDHKEGEI